VGCRHASISGGVDNVETALAMARLRGEEANMVFCHPYDNVDVVAAPGVHSHVYRQEHHDSSATTQQIKFSLDILYPHYKYDRLSMSNSTLISVVVGALEITPEKITNETQSSDIEEWDSLGHISILVALDEVVPGVLESVPELASATSISELRRLLIGYPQFH